MAARITSGAMQCVREGVVLRPIGVPQVSVGEWSHDLVHGQTFRVTGSGFGVKPVAKPLMIFRADDGKKPNGTLGQLTEWDAGESASIVSTAVVGPGAMQSLAHDITEGAATAGQSIGGEIYFESDQLYVFKRRYDAYTFQQSTVFSISFVKDGVDSMQGAAPAAGQIVTGGLSGATGEVHSVTSTMIYFVSDSPTTTINQPDGLMFTQDETLSWDGGSCTNYYGSAQKERNDKHIRLWRGHTAPNHNNMYAQRVSQHYGNNALFAEHTGLGPEYQDSRLEPPEHAWYADELIFQISDVDTQNGIFYPYMNGKGWSNTTRRFRHRTSASPERYRKLALDQFTRRPRTHTCIRYLDYVYVDTSWHRAIVSDSPQLYLNDGTNTSDINLCPLPIIGWADDGADLVYQDYVPNGRYLHIVNGDNTVAQTFDRGAV